MADGDTAAREALDALVVFLRSVEPEPTMWAAMRAMEAASVISQPGLVDYIVKHRAEILKKAGR